MAKSGTIKESMAQLTEIFHSRMASMRQKLDSEESHVESGPEAVLVQAESEFTQFRDFIILSLDVLQKQVELVARNADDTEMRSRRKMILVHGIKASDSSGREDTAGLVVEKLKSIKSDFSATDIGRCHRLGKTQGSKPSPILVKLRDVSVRDELWFGKGSLKGTGVTMGEFLTKPRQELFAAAHERFGVRGCWTWIGDVFVLGAAGKRVRVSSLAHLKDMSVAAGATIAAKSNAEKSQPPAKRTRRAPQQ